MISLLGLNFSAASQESVGKIVREWRRVGEIGRGKERVRSVTCNFERIHLAAQLSDCVGASDPR